MSLGTFTEIADQAEHIARLARALADAEASRSSEVAGFRRGSSAHRAANLLLDSRGKWLTRGQISDVSGCRPNAVVVVAEKLRANGVPVERRTIGGKAHYRVGESS